MALLSKFAGGIGIAYHRVRSRGSLIRATNGKSNGIVPWLKTLDSSVAAVNQGGKRKGACCVYLETWHADIEEFLELRDNTGDEARRTHNLNIANWIPDLFMGVWKKTACGRCSIPSWCLTLPICSAKRSRQPMLRPNQKRFVRETSKSARALCPHDEDPGRNRQRLDDVQRCMQSQVQSTGDAGPNVVHLSNLCTEIVEVSSKDETAVCNLGSINLAAMSNRWQVRL